jgi:hypothetical protein
MLPGCTFFSLCLYSDGCLEIRRVSREDLKSLRLSVSIYNDNDIVRRLAKPGLPVQP